MSDSELLVLFMAGETCLVAGLAGAILIYAWLHGVRTRRV